MEELRSWWEVPSIAHFCSLFRAAFDLSDFDIEDLEEGLLDSQKEGGCEFLTDLVCKLLNGCYGRNDICSFNYDLYVKDIIKYKWDSTGSPILQKSMFNELTLRERVEVIHAICEYRLDGEDVMELLKGFDGDSMRVEPLGKDKEGGLYWYFYGSRLYKEDPEPKKELTKEQKRKQEREKRKEQERKKKLEKERKKQEKVDRKIARRVEKKKLLEMKQREKEEESQGKRRRSGRIQKIQEQQLMESSESSSEESSEESESESEESSEEDSESSEEEEEESNSDTEIEEPPVVETKPQKKDNKKETPAKVKTTTEKPVPVEKKAGQRQSTRKKAKVKQEEDTPQNTRRSGRLRQRKETPSSLIEDGQSDSGIDESDKNQSDTDDDTKSIRSEVSRRSSRSEVSTRSDSVKKELPKVRTRSGKKQTNSLEENKQNDNSKTDSEKPKRGRGRLRKNVQSNEESEETAEVDDAQTEEEQNCVENHVNMAESDNKKQPEAITRKRRLRYSTESKIKPEKDDKGEETKTEIKLENDADNADTHEENIVKPEIESEKQLCKDGNESVKQETSDGDCKTSEELDTKDLEKKTVDDNVKASDDKDFSEAKSKVKSESEGEQITDENNCDTNNSSTKAEKKEEIVGHAEQNQEIKKESTEGEENEKDETEGEKKLDPVVSPEPKPRPKPTPPPKSKTDSRWHLICTTLDDWINLAEWFKESAVRCEKALSKVIEEDFLPVLPEIIETREKEKARRIRENEQRKSARITQKQREKLEQEKILAEAAAEEEKARKEAEEERRLKEEQQKLEEENRLREERFKAREERAKRLSMREERARLVAEGKEIPPELIYTGLPAQRYKDDFDSDDSRPDILDDESFQSLLKVIDGMKNHKDCWPFLEPVTEEQAPGYHDVIKRPMDLSKIEKKVELREYRTQHHFLSDFRLMFNNCRRFNGPESDFTGCAKTMEKVLKNLVKKHLLDQSTDSYYNDEDFVAGGAKGAQGEKKFRPKRQAGTKALQTVQKALKDDEQSSSDDDSYIEPLKKPRKAEPISPTVNSLLLQEMIEFKRKRAEQQRTGQLSPQKPSTTQGIMIMPRDEIPTDGVLRLAASREIKWKIDPKSIKLKEGMVPVQAGASAVVKTQEAGFQQMGTIERQATNPNSTVKPATNPNPAGLQPKSVNVVHKKAAGLAPGQKIIKILASAPGSGLHAVKQTAESVKVSSDGFLILNGKPTTIKVTPNTKIVIQPQPTGAQASDSASGAGSGAPLGRELFIKKIPTPAGCQPLQDVEASSTPQPRDHSSNVPTIASIAAASDHGQSQAQVSVNTKLSRVPSVPNTIYTDKQPGVAPGKVAIQTPALSKTAVQPGLVPGVGIGQVTGPNSNIAVSQDQVEVRKRQLDIAQRLLAAKRRQLMQQNGPVTPKMARLDSDNTSLKSNPVINEQGLTLNTVNSSAGNVLQNVNISNDILDSYYSVMNETGAQKTVPSNTLNTQQQVNSVQPKPVAGSGIINVQQGSNVTHAMNVSVPQHTPVNLNRLLQSSAVKPSTTTPVTASGLQLNTNDSGLVKTMSLSALTTALARSIAAGNFHRTPNNDGRQQVVTQRQLSNVSNSNIVSANQLTSHNQANSSPVTNSGNSVVISLDNQGGITQQTLQVNQPLQTVIQPVQQLGQPVQHVNQPIQHIPSNLSSAVSELIESTVIKGSVSNLLTTDSVGFQSQPVANLTNIQQVPTLQPVSNLTNLQNQSKVSQSEIKPIEALFTGQTSPVVLSPTKPLSSTSASQFLPNLNISPPKSDRQNLFDVFESGKETGRQSTKSDDFGFANLSEKADTSKLPTTMKHQVTYDVTMKGTGKAFIGSPLNTSVMEALKSKLSPGKLPAVSTVASFTVASPQVLQKTSQCVDDADPCSTSIVASPKDTCSAQDTNSPSTVVNSVSLDLDEQDTTNTKCITTEAQVTKPNSVGACDTNLPSGNTVNSLNPNIESQNRESHDEQKYTENDKAVKAGLNDPVGASKAKKNLSASFLEICEPEIYIDRKKEPVMIFSVKEENTCFVENWSRPASLRQSEIKDGSIHPYSHIDEVKASFEAKDEPLIDHLSAGMSVYPTDLKGCECKAEGNLSNVDKLLCSERIDDIIKKQPDFQDEQKLKGKNELQHCMDSDKFADNACQAKSVGNDGCKQLEISDRSMMCKKKSPELLSVKVHTNVSDKSCTSIDDGNDRFQGSVILVRDLEPSNDILRDSAKNTLHKPPMGNQNAGIQIQKTRDSAQIIQGFSKKKFGNAIDSGSIPPGPVESEYLPERPLDTSVQTFSHAPYSVFDLKKQCKVTQKKAKKVNRLGQDKTAEGQVWHIKSPEDLGKKGFEILDQDTELSFAEYDTSLPVADETTDQNIFLKNKFSLRARFYPKRRTVSSNRDTISAGQSPTGIKSKQSLSDNKSKLPLMVKKSKRLFTDSKSKQSLTDSRRKQSLTDNKSIANSKLALEVPIQPPMLYKLRGVSSDSALVHRPEVDNDDKLGLARGSVRKKLRGIKNCTFEETPQKQRKISAVYSDSVLNYSVIGSCEKNKLNPEENELPLDDIPRNIKNSVRAIPYSCHLSGRRSLKKTLELKKPFAMKISRWKSKSLSSPFEYKCKKALRYPESKIGFTNFQEHMNSPLLGDKHVSVVCSTPSPSVFYNLGGGDSDDESDSRHDNSSSSFSLDEHLLMDNLNLLPDLVADPDLNRIENDIFELQEQYLKPAELTSRLPVYSSVDPGIQDQHKGHYLSQQMLGSQNDSLKQPQKVSISIAEDNFSRNWQQQTSQNHGNVQSKVVVQSLPHVQTLLDRPNHLSAIESNLNTRSAPLAEPNSVTNQTKTIESIFASNDLGTSNSNSLTNLIATSFGHQNVTAIQNKPLQTSLNQTPLIAPNLIGSATYVGSINVVPGSAGSQTITIPHDSQINSSQISSSENNERLRQLEEMLKDIGSLQQPVMNQPSIVTVSSTESQHINESNGDRVFPESEQEVQNMEQPSA